MATTNSAPHRHTHPSLTRTRRPKKLPAPSPSATRSFWDRFFRHARLLPASFVIPRRLLSLAARWLYVTVARMPLASHPPLLLPPLLRRVHRDDRLRDVQSQGLDAFSHAIDSRVGQEPLGGASGVRSHETSSLSPVPPSPRVTLATRLTGSFFHRA